MVLDYRKLKAEFKEMQKKEKQRKHQKKHLEVLDILEEDLSEKETEDAQKKKEYWEYLMKNLR